MDPEIARSPRDEVFDDGFDENLMGDEEDKKKLAQMTEKEREQELFNRSERRETLKIRFEIERKLKYKAKKREQERKQSARKRLRASEIYSSDESSDESEEYTPEIVKSSSEQTKQNNRSILVTSSSSSSASSASSESSSSESEQEDNELEADEGVESVKNDFEMTLADLKTLQLKRDRIERWAYAPFFRETAIGLFVKISVGNHPQTNLHMYRVAQVVDITKGNTIYPINVEFLKTKTDKQCVVRIGRVERTYKMSFVSNRPFDDDDYARWKDQIQIDGQDMPSREYFIKKQRDLHKAVTYSYQDADIAYEVAERCRFNDNPSNFALKKTELMGEKADAEASNDYEKARQIQQCIDELEEKTRQLEKTRSSSTFSAISIVNERNRYKNIVESERVLRENKSVKTEDPFTRRKCTPTIVHNKNNGDSSNPAIKEEVSKQVANNNDKPSKVEHLKSVDDLFQAHASIDLELDIDI